MKLPPSFSSSFANRRSTNTSGTRVRGPFSLSINEEIGLLVDGFSTPPMMLMGHDPEYAAAQLEALGYRKEMDTFARWIAGEVPTPEPILAIHSLGRRHLPALPYAIFLSGHLMPVQSFDPAATHRV